MKKFIFLLLIFMAGIGWSMPPPAEEQNLFPGKELTIRQEVSFIQPQLIYFQDVTEAQEVAYIYKGDYLVNKISEVSLIGHDLLNWRNAGLRDFSICSIGIFQFPYNNNSNNRLLLIQNNILNRQNSNFGYPLTAN